MPIEQTYAPLGAEFTVNTTFARSQAQSDVAQLANGNFIVTWIDADFNTTTGRFLKAQVYAPDGTRLGGETTLASVNGGIQPSVAGLANGGYVVSWLSLGSLVAQVFDAGGIATGAAFTVTPASGASGINRPDVAALAGGGFAIVWDDARTTGGDISGQSVHLRAFSSTGAPVGGDVLVNVQTSRNQADASITALADGGYVVTWTDRGASAGWLVKAQIFSAAGARVGTEFVVNGNVSGFPSSVESSVTTLANGNFAVAWYESSSTSGHHVQVFSAAGVRVGEEVSTPSNLVGTQTGPVVSALADGGYAIAWTRDGAGTADGSGRAVFVQVYDAGGQPNGAPTLVNSQANGDQLDPSIVGLANGNFVISWTDLNGAGADDDQVKAQVFGHPLPLVIVSGGGGDSAAVTVGENSTLATVVAAQGGSGTIHYQIAGGADAGLFAIDAASGALSFAAAPDFEAPGDSDRDNVYQVVVSATDGSAVDSQALSVTVTNRNEAPAFVSGGGGDSASVSINENQGNVLALAAVDPDGTTPQIGIAGGADAALFELDPFTRGLRFKDLPDFEAPRDADHDNVYQVIVGTTDGQYFDYQTIFVTVANVYEGIRFATSTVAFSVDENGTQIGGVGATGEPGAVLHYSLAGGGDALRFAIDPDTGVLSFVGAPDFENPGDSGGDNVYSFVVSASDGRSSASQSVTVTVGDVDEAVEIVSYGGAGTVALTMAENGWRVGAVGAVDPEGDPVTYSIAGGADSGLFAIDAASGELTFLGAPPDFEAPADADGDNVYEVSVAAHSGTSLDTQAFAVTIVNENEGIFIRSNGGGTSASVSMGENGRYVTTVIADDPDGTVPIYSIVGGPDGKRFTIDAATGELSFIDPPDFEAPAGIGGSNFYTVEVAASDGEYTTSQTIQIHVDNVNEGLEFVSYSGSDMVYLNVAENQQAAARAEAVDRDGDAPTYSITGGADAALFAIDSATGALSFIASPDYEAPADSDGDNVYAVVVTASDGTFSDRQAFGIVLTNINEPLAITSNGGGASAGISIGENGRAVTTVSAADPDGASVTYAIAGGADAALFTIDAATGALAFVAAPNFEAPADAGGNNVYDVVVSASDGTFIDTQALAVSVGNVDETLAITSNGGGSSASVTIGENGRAVTTVAAADPDGATVTYSIAGGVDAARFTIDPATGALAFVTAPDFEAPADAGANNVYDVVVAASDGSFTDTQAIAVAVGNVDEGVRIVSYGGDSTVFLTIGENGSAAGQVAGKDQDGDAVSYAIVGGADAGLFRVDAATGALSFVASPNFEAPADANGDNVYKVEVAAIAGAFSATQAFAVTVANVNEGVSITSSGGGSSAAVSVVENGRFVTSVAATDADGTPPSFSIVGGADASRFTINAQTGALQFVTAPDYEAPGDSNGDNVYSVVVQAGDGQFADVQTLSVTVTNLRDGNNVTGTSGNDSISGTSSNPALRTSNSEDNVSGGGGHDTILGLGGDDYLSGDAGNDTLTGGAGADLLTGGPGKDDFVYTAVSDSTAAARDVITDFSRAQGDRIDLSAIDANSNLASNQAFAFIGSAAFSHVAGQLRFDIVGGSTFISGDVNGDGVADFQIELTGTIAPVASDFVL